MDVELISTSHPVAELLTKSVPTWGLQIAVFSLEVLFFGMIIHKLFVVAAEIIRLRKICQTSAPLIWVVTSPKLQEKLASKKVRLLLSNDVDVPTAALYNTILFPMDQVEQLSQDEFEAIVAHELEHLLWHDPLLKFTSSIVGSFFWWLPTKWWLKRLEEEQEYASDASTLEYGLENHALASAILKISKQTHEQKTRSEPLCYLTRNRSFTVRRINKLLNHSSSKPFKLYRMRAIALALIGLLLVVVFRIC